MFCKINRDIEEFVIKDLDQFIQIVQEKKWPTDKILKLDLSNYLNSNQEKLNKDSIKLITNVIPNAPFGFKLDLRGNKINGEAAKILAEAIKQAPQYFYLHLGGCQIGKNEIEYFSDTLAQAPEGFTLNLDDNCIEDEGLQIIMKNMQNFPYYFELILSDCRIWGNSLKTIAENIKNAPLGLKLNLSVNSLGVNLDVLAEAMKNNMTIIECNVIPCTWHQFDYKKNHENIINHCCLRNKLILQYPEFTPLIKKLSYEAGLYKVNVTDCSIPSLKYKIGSFLAFNQQKLMSENKLDKGFMIKLPKDLQNFIMNFNLIKQQLHSENNIAMKN